ncbi:MAG TPA: hypothetical protein VFU93_06070 [Acidimicrobiales bacterium]|nr:hypothetical protein [Acidimicrobiales bacterium]
MTVVMLLVVMVLLAGTAVVALLALASASAPPFASPEPTAHRAASMRLVFVTVHDGHVVLDGLLELEPPSLGVPTSWSFECPAQPVLASAVVHVLQGWAEDGAPVAIDLSNLAGSHSSVAFSRGEVQIRLSALTGGLREQA